MASNYEVKTGNDLVWIATIAYILTSDRVLGDPANVLQGSNLTGKINQVIQGVVDNLNYLKHAVDNVDVPEKANQTQGRSGTDDEFFITSLRLLDALQNGGSFKASTTQRGAIEISTLTELRAGTLTDRALTPKLLRDFIEGSIFLTGDIRDDNQTLSISSGGHGITWMPTLNEIWVQQTSSPPGIRRYSVASDGSITANGTHTANGGHGITWMPTLNEVWGISSSGGIRRYSVANDGSLTANGTHATVSGHGITWMPSLNEIWVVTQSNTTLRRYSVASDGSITANGTHTIASIANGITWIPDLNEIWIVPQGNTTLRRYSVANDGNITANGTHALNGNAVGITWMPTLNEIWDIVGLTIRRYEMETYLKFRFT